jgi:hypothetical protein
MSNPSAKRNSSAQHAGTESQRSVLDRAASAPLLVAIRTAGFWGAVTLPFLHLPLLFAGIETPVEVGMFLSLLVGNVVALLVGHPHRL